MVARVCLFVAFSLCVGEESVGVAMDGGAVDTSWHPEPGFHRDPAGSTVSCGHFHTCALRASAEADFGGIAHCWGFDVMGQVSRTPPSTLFIQLSSGHFHTCGVTLEEKIVCWGGEREAYHSPAGLFQQVTAGEFHSCGLTKDGDARCWGEDHLTGATKPPAGKWVQLEAGNDFTCGLRPSGLVECWGGNVHGQTNAPPETQFVQLTVASSSPQACGLTLDGADLVCWGRNTKGQAPAFVEGPFVQVSTGYKTTCAITEDASNVQCWGVNKHLFTTAALGAESALPWRVSLLRRDRSIDRSHTSPVARARLARHRT